MNEIFDKLLIRILFTIFICVALLLYKYAHLIFYPSSKKQVFRRIYPSENYVDTMHFFSRLIGVSIIFSSLEFNEYIGISISAFHFFVWSIIGFTFYLVSIYIMENIIFSNFDYKDEVLQKKNPAYGIISFVNAICLAFIIKAVFKESENSIVILVILWLFSLVLYGISTKFFKYICALHFDSLMIQKNIGLALAYSGFLFGNMVLLRSVFSHERLQIQSYLILVVLKTLLAILIMPLFRAGIHYVFKIEAKENQELDQDESTKHLGQGIYIASVYLTTALLTSIIVSQIHFGTIYPFF